MKNKKYFEMNEYESTADTKCSRKDCSTKCFCYKKQP